MRTEIIFEEKENLSIMDFVPFQLYVVIYDYTEDEALKLAQIVSELKEEADCIYSENDGLVDFETENIYAVHGRYRLPIKENWVDLGWQEQLIKVLDVVFEDKWSPSQFVNKVYVN